MGTQKPSSARQSSNAPLRIGQTKTGGTSFPKEPDDPVDRLLSRDPRLVGLNRLIRRHQSELRGQCSEEAWRTYLRVEELTTELTFSLADLLLKQPK
jgi:hypothetical protein